VVPLIPYLRGIKTFAEPCAGDGDLVRRLEEFGLRCVYVGDIRTGQDALNLDSYGATDAITTKSTYSRDALHRLTRTSKGVSVTWRLLPADCVSTLQGVPLRPLLGHRDDRQGEIQVQQQDNFAWYRFDARHKGATARPAQPGCARTLTFVITSNYASAPPTSLPDTRAALQGAALREAGRSTSAWGNRVILLVGRLLPVCLWKRTSSEPVGTSQTCQLQTFLKPQSLPPEGMAIEPSGETTCFSGASGRVECSCP
jgi:hypothetical protein